MKSAYGRFCSLIPGFGVKLSAIILAGPTVLSAVGACPPHDGVRRRWWINVASAVSLMRARKKSGDLTTAIVPAGTSFPARARTLEAGRLVDRRLEAERGDRADTRYGHEPSDLCIITCQLQNLTIEIVGLLLDGLTCLEQRPNHSHQLGAILDQFLGPHGKDIELGSADHETDVLEQAADLVLEIPFDLDQQRPARQQRPNRVAIEIFDAHLFKPAGLHDASDASRIVAVTLIDLHLEYRLCMARVDTDHRQAQVFELGPHAFGRRSCLKADPYRSRCVQSHERGDRLRLRIDYALSHD